MKIIGVGGTNASGKDTVGEMLVERHGFLFVSVSELLREEATKRNIAPDRKALRTISAEWREESGLGVLVAKSIETFEQTNPRPKGLVLASLRNPGEADEIHKLDGIVVWVDADPKVRYQRIMSTDRGRSAEDQKTFEEFLAEEAVEMTGEGKTETQLHIAAVKEKADMTIFNNGNNKEAFKEELQKLLQNYLT